jgi:hypothetical protein
VVTTKVAAHGEHLGFGGSGLKQTPENLPALQGPLGGNEKDQGAFEGQITENLGKP